MEEIFILMYALRNFLSAIILLAGIILLLVNKFIHKKMLGVIGLVFTVVSLLVLTVGCYNAFLKPQYEPIDITENELVSFADYVIEDERFKDINKFLPNNDTMIKESFNEDLKLKASASHYFYDRNCQISCFVDEYEDEVSAANNFNELIKDAELSSVITNEKYSLYVPPVEYESTFFNLHEGEHSTRTLTFVISYEKYNITILETTEKRTPIFYYAVKNNIFYNSDLVL